MEHPERSGRQGGRRHAGTSGMRRVNPKRMLFLMERTQQAICNEWLGFFAMLKTNWFLSARKAERTPKGSPTSTLSAALHPRSLADGAARRGCNPTSLAGAGFVLPKGASTRVAACTDFPELASEVSVRGSRQNAARGVSRSNGIALGGVGRGHALLNALQRDVFSWERTQPSVANKGLAFLRCTKRTRF